VKIGIPVPMEKYIIIWRCKYTQQ